jgi:hypothetical protein
MTDELDQSYDEINSAKLHNEFQDRLDENISKTDEQISSLEVPQEKTNIGVDIPDGEGLNNLMKNIQNMSQKDRNNLMANLMPMINNKMNPSNKTFSSVTDNDRKFLLDKLKSKREQMTMMRKPRKHIEQHVQQQMEKIKNSAGVPENTNSGSGTTVDIAGNVVPVASTSNSFQLPAGLSKSQKKRMKKKMKSLGQKSETNTVTSGADKDESSDEE